MCASLCLKCCKNVLETCCSRLTLDLYFVKYTKYCKKLIIGKKIVTKVLLHDKTL